VFFIDTATFTPKFAKILSPALPVGAQKNLQNDNHAQPETDPHPAQPPVYTLPNI